jgi:cytidylate kinase
MKDFIVAVDGPAGSGKSTISKKIAEKLKLTYLDTGAMYRMITYYVIKNNVDIENQNKLEEILNGLKLDIKEDRFFLNGEDISDEIRGVEVTNNVSKVAAIKIVREKLVDLQRSISKGKKVILDGRDIGTVVFPDADIKIFLVASPSERAKRRLKDFQNKGIEHSYEEVLDEIVKRDKMDSERKESPLKKAEDAIEIDTSSMTIDEVSIKIIDLIKNI